MERAALGHVWFLVTLELGQRHMNDVAAGLMTTYASRRACRRRPSSNSVRNRISYLALACHRGSIVQLLTYILEESSSMYK